MKSVRIQLFISGPFFSTFITNRIKYEPEKIPNSKTFHTVQFVLTFSAFKMMLYMTQSTFICSKLTIETLEQDVKYVQS